VITDAAVEVGPALFFSFVIITLSFVPVFTLEAQEAGCLRRSLSPRPTRWRPPRDSP
jgi:hypothetical protein